MRHPALTLYMALLLSACGGEAAVSSGTSDGPDASGLDAAPPLEPTAPTPGQEILFEVRYENHAWGHEASGVFINRNGEVYTYDASDVDPGDSTQVFAGMTEDEISARYGDAPTLLTKLDESTLLDKFSFVGAAQLGSLLSDTICADAGSTDYVAWLYDAATELYTPVALGTEGDRWVQNTAPEAASLMAWLRGFSGTSTSCQRTLGPCGGTLCPEVPPCEDGMVPTFPTQQGCMNRCFPPTFCDFVDNCSVCDAAQLRCMLDQAGRRHCLGWIPGCSENIDCSCGGDALCAGGASYCRLSGTTFSCSPP